MSNAITFDVEENGSGEGERLGVDSLLPTGVEFGVEHMVEHVSEGEHCGSIFFTDDCLFDFQSWFDVS